MLTAIGQKVTRFDCRELVWLAPLVSTPRVRAGLQRPYQL